MLVCRIATLEQGATVTVPGHDYQQHGYYDYSAYYQQPSVAGILCCVTCIVYLCFLTLLLCVCCCY